MKKKQEAAKKNEEVTITISRRWRSPSPTASHYSRGSHPQADPNTQNLLLDGDIEKDMTHLIVVI